MANALVVRHSTQLARAQRALQAAQYVRMSTELQRYSTQNQAAAIAAYAQQRNLTIVRTYVDEGKSGLRINRRPGLRALIRDVQSGNANFDHILVYDVSRWGRFQDADESAHYEFICKQNGIKVAYCAEPFDNDGTLLSSIVKNVKRVMAAEFSRELGVKVHAGHCRTVSHGYRVGSPLTYGLRREMVDDEQRTRGPLSKGEYKALKTDRVRLRLGSDNELAIVQSIFQQFVVGREPFIAIARRLNQAGVSNHHGRPWTDIMIRAILKNENYAGNLLYNRTSRRLGQKLVNNPACAWVRASGVLPPVIDQDLFACAQKIMDDRYISIPEDEMIRKLRLLLARKGKLSTRIIHNAPGVPSVGCFIKHFGSLRKAYARIGYAGSRDSDWIDTRAHWAAVVSKLATRTAEALNRDSGIDLKLTDDGSALVDSKGTKFITFRVVRRMVRRTPNHVALWRGYLRKDGAPKFYVFLRLGEANKTVQDYLLIAASHRFGPYLTLSDCALARLGAVRAGTVDKLITQLRMRQLIRTQTPRRHPPARVRLSDNK